MPVTCACGHENDPAKVVMIACPSLEVLEACSANPSENLYREMVIPERVVEQHETMCDVLEMAGVRVVDALAMLPPEVCASCSAEDIANILFTRDAMLCTPKGVVLGRFREPCRQAETQLVETILANMRVPHLGCVEAPGIVEGGDFIPAGDRCFIACGNRTNRAGIQQMMDQDWFGTDAVAVVEYPEDGDMSTIHLDCYVGLVGRRHAVVWDWAAQHVCVQHYERVEGTGTYAALGDKCSLGEYFARCGYEVLPVSRECQRAYGCNLLDLGNNTVVTQDVEVTRMLQERGYRVYFVEFDEVHKMYGGIRCATQVLVRMRI
jgi:arginine deiminase